MSAVDLLISQFHFLRPWWLVALAPVLVVALLLWYQKHNARSWQQMVAPELLQYLLDGQTTRIRPWQLIALLLAWIISCIALAGPSWEKRPVAVEQNQQALVLLLDLSPSMMSEDVKPSRLVRARLKIADLLRLRKDGQTALLVYAGDVHVVTPLTDDTETINNIIPALHPNIMPAQGSNTEEAVSRAIQLLKNAAITQGDLLLITDGIDKDAQYNISEIMTRESQYRLSILGVGGTAPTPIPSSKGGFVRDNKRNIVTTQLNAGELQNLANQSRGRYRTLASTSSDIDYLMDLPTPKKEETQRVERDFDSWYDRGHWLVLLLLPIILYCFRRGVLLCLFIVPLTALTPNKSYAFGWDDLWKNKNQQAYEKLQQEQAAEAAQQFDHPDWKASAQYRAGDYEEAAKNFAQSDDADAHYNRGNALAKASKLPDAIKAYDQALKLNPELEDAKINRKLVEELLKQQQQNQDQQDKDEQDQKDQDQQKQDQGNSDQQKDEQQQDQQQQDKNDQQKQQDQNNQQDQNQQQNQSDQQSQQDQQSSAGQNEQQKQSEQEKSDQEQSQQEKTDEEKAAEAAQREQEEQQAAEEKMQQMQAGEPKDDGLTDEERQAMEQWLRRIPDDPGGLLRNKFNYEHYKRNQEILNGDWEPAENGAEDRW
ncbi:vWA domain-containing protein [Cellvibrio fibrivorans]|uniref:Ca-activated chloride channel family protein n=1 Tax=Cellvibrio fibrivorans TaxID=126350 RepID=A0ABU1UV47_9GAMM|nr:VWA domain-containing protein [Cellvibrio fibrivorans]MDR7089070.1 Ca-activated chloride channel family protein [Cellvibrio fibrivorans]